MPLVIRSILYALFIPGSVAGWIPWWLVRNTLVERIHDAQWYQGLGIPLFIIGVGTLITCIVKFTSKGKGTLSPTDPTQYLVVAGMYRYSRNPMYVGVMAILLGWAIGLMGSILWWYVLIVFVMFNLFIRFIEEPRLRKDFGIAYDEYRKKVRRWL